MSADVCRPYPWKCNPTEAGIAIDLHQRGLLPIGDVARRVKVSEVQILANRYRSRHGVDPKLNSIVRLLEMRQAVR